MKIKNATDLFAEYPKLRIRGYVKALNLSGDLYCISKTGRCIRVKHGIAYECRKKPKIDTDWENSKTWFELEIKDFELIDEGVGDNRGNIHCGIDKVKEGLKK